MSSPTYPITPVVLVEGAGTRAFSAVSLAANDWLVCEIITEQNTAGETFPVTCPGLTFAIQTDAGTGGGDCRILQVTAQDVTGASRTVTITPSSGTRLYRALLTPCRGSAGPGTGEATSLTAQTVSVTRQGDDSSMFMAIGDFSAGALGTPVWLPSGDGVTISSQQGTGATYIFGRVDSAGTPDTELHGIATPSYTTPSIAVLEMLGTATAPETEVAPGVYRKVPPARFIRR